MYSRSIEICVELVFWFCFFQLFDLEFHGFQAKYKSKPKACFSRLLESRVFQDLLKHQPKIQFKFWRFDD